LRKSDPETCKIRLVLRSNDSERLDILLLPTGKSKHYVIVKGILLEVKEEPYPPDFQAWPTETHSITRGKSSEHLPRLAPHLTREEGTFYKDQPNAISRIYRHYIAVRRQASVYTPRRKP